MSETIQDSAIITVECQWELVCDLSNGAIFNDLEKLSSQISSACHYIYILIHHQDGSMQFIQDS